jgi:hypothetical protein
MKQVVTAKRGKSPLPKLFVPKTPAEKQLVLLVEGLLTRAMDDGFSEWHAWAHKIGETGKCPNSSPFLAFLKAWVEAGHKTRYPIFLAGYLAFVKSIDPDAIVKIHRKPTKAKGGRGAVLVGRERSS